MEYSCHNIVINGFVWLMMLILYDPNLGQNNKSKRSSIENLDASNAVLLSDLRLFTFQLKPIGSRTDFNADRISTKVDIF